MQGLGIKFDVNQYAKMNNFNVEKCGTLNDGTTLNILRNQGKKVTQVVQEKNGYLVGLIGHKGSDASACEFLTNVIRKILK